MARGPPEVLPGAVLAVTHDRYFLDNVAEWIAEVDRGSIHGYEGNYSTYLETKKERLKVEGAKDAKRAKMLEKELEWVRSNAKARQTKSKSRLARYEELAAEADKARKIDAADINIPPGPRLGDIVLEAEHLTKASRTGSSGTTSPSRCRGPASSASSAPTASARPPSSG